MIKITSVEIDGFIVPSQKVKLDFVESNIVCIYGNNGSGKTTFLEILFAIFDRNEKILFEYKVNRIKLNYISDNLDSFESVYIGLDIDEYGNECYNFDSLDISEFNNVSSLFLGIGRGIHKNELQIPRNMLWYFFSKINVEKELENSNKLTGNDIDNLTDKLSEHLMSKSKNDANSIESYEAKVLDNKKNIYLPSIEIDTLEAFLKSKYKEAVLDAKGKIEKALSKTSLNSLKFNFQSVRIDLEELQEKLIYNKSLLLEMFSRDEDMGIETVFNSLEEDEDFLEQIDNYQQIILSTIIKELQSEVELFKEIQVFLDEYNSFLNYDKNLVLSSNGVFVTPENHSIQKLSSGERHLLTFLATILLMGEEQDFILIDEPEISLNVDWQRKILSTIAKLAPNSQIIVATHSPLIGRSYRKSVVGLEPKVIDEE
jgi:energy-coupling factor transporter ATP-binding protein EcfA2